MKAIWRSKETFRIDEATLLLLAYVIYVVVEILNSSTISRNPAWDTIYWGAVIVVLVLMVPTMLLSVNKKISLKRILICLGLALLGILVLRLNQRGRVMVLSTAFMLLGMTLPQEKVLKSYLKAAIPAVLLVLLLYFLKILPFEESIDEGRHRLFMGFTYITRLPNYFFHILLAWLALRKKKITVVSTIVILLMNYWIDLKTDTRAVYYVVYLLMAVIWLERVWPGLFRGLVFKYGAIWIMPILAIVAIGITMNYSPSKGWMANLDGILSGRLRLGYRAIQVYGIPIFGRETEWASGANQGGNYFYVDSSYVNIMLTFGVAVLVLLIIGFMNLMRNSYEQGEMGMCIAIVFLAIHSATDPQLFDLRHDPFLLLLVGASVERIKKRRGIGRQRKKDLFVANR